MCPLGCATLLMVVRSLHMQVSGLNTGGKMTIGIQTMNCIVAARPVCTSALSPGAVTLITTGSPFSLCCSEPSGCHLR